MTDSYETLALSLAIERNPQSYDRARELAYKVKSYHTFPCVSPFDKNPTEKIKADLARELKVWIVRENPFADPALHGALYADLVAVALKRVNWLDLAEGFLRDIPGKGEF